MEELIAKSNEELTAMIRECEIAVSVQQSSLPMPSCDFRMRNTDSSRSTGTFVRGAEIQR